MAVIIKYAFLTWIKRIGADYQVPENKDALVQDIAINNKGTELFAAISTDDSSWLAVASIGKFGELTWKNSSFFQKVKYVSLAISPKNQLFAIAQAIGLHQININKLTIKPEPIGSKFKATGLLHISSEGDRIYAGEFKEKPEDFNAIKIISLTRAIAQGTISVPVNGRDAANNIATLDEYPPRYW
ncbi:MAG: hypothetical protein IPM82_11965 [Saprospiraceae bacterium]|nr:hypothetical protein [Saprospiraceae bacterium]